VSDSPKKPNIVEIVGLPTIAAGAGTLIGGVTGGLLARKALLSPGMRSRFSKLSPEKQQRILNALIALSASGSATASAAGSYALASYLDELKEEDDQK